MSGFSQNEVCVRFICPPRSLTPSTFPLQILISILSCSLQVSSDRLQLGICVFMIVILGIFLQWMHYSNEIWDLEYRLSQQRAVAGGRGYPAAPTSNRGSSSGSELGSAGNIEARSRQRAAPPSNGDSDGGRGRHAAPTSNRSSSSGAELGSAGNIEERGRQRAAPPPSNRTFSPIRVVTVNSDGDSIDGDDENAGRQ